MGVGGFATESDGERVLGDLGVLADGVHQEHGRLSALASSSSTMIAAIVRGCGIGDLITLAQVGDIIGRPCTRSGDSWDSRRCVARARCYGPIVRSRPFLRTGHVCASSPYADGWPPPPCSPSSPYRCLPRQLPKPPLTSVSRERPASGLSPTRRGSSGRETGRRQARATGLSCPGRTVRSRGPAPSPTGRSGRSNSSPIAPNAQESPQRLFGRTSPTQMSATRSEASAWHLDAPKTRHVFMRTLTIRANHGLPGRSTTIAAKTLPALVKCTPELPTTTEARRPRCLRETTASTTTQISALTSSRQLVLTPEHSR